MSSASAPETARAERRLVAPLWHTGLLIAILVAITLAGSILQGRGRPGGAIVGHRPSVVPIYLSLIAAEWGLVRFVWAGGLRRTGTRARDLIGGEWKRWTDVARDAGLALAFWAAVTAASSAIQSVLSPGAAKSIDVLLPRGLLEALPWVALSLSAGFCEEFVFRGYLQTQLFALTGSRATALVLQALLFAAAHSYQGLRSVVVILVYGLLYGGLALWRRSLRHGMLAHAWTDVASGLLFRS